MNNTDTTAAIGPAAKVGAALFALWGVLHVWVGFAGAQAFLTQGTRELWEMLIGGAKMPREAFQHTTDAATAYAQGHLILNFCLDVGGYGVLGFFVAWLLYKRGSWLGYFLGVFVIGIADLAFLFVLVTSGVIAFGPETLGGPVIWFLACVITPFGLKRP